MSEKISQIKSEVSELKYDTGQEAIMEVCGRIASMMPGLGQVIGNELVGRANSRRYQRVGKVLEDFVQHLSDEQTRVDEEYIKGDDFPDIFTETMERVAREHYEEKRRLFSDILMREISDPTQYKYSQKEAFLKTLDQLTVTHIHYLKGFELEDVSGEDVVYDSIEAGVRRRLGSRHFQSAEFQNAVRDLQRLGILIEFSPKMMVSPIPIHSMQGYVSSFGLQFLNFIKYK